jgi:hypothetical protein
VGEVEDAGLPSSYGQEGVHLLEGEGLLDPRKPHRIPYQFRRYPQTHGIVLVEGEKERAPAADPVHHEPDVRRFDAGEVEEVVALKKAVVGDRCCRAGDDDDPIGDFIHQILPPGGVLGVAHQGAGSDVWDLPFGGTKGCAPRLQERKSGEEGEGRGEGNEPENARYAH